LHFIPELIDTIQYTTTHLHINRFENNKMFDRTVHFSEVRDFLCHNKLQKIIYISHIYHSKSNLANQVISKTSEET